MENRTRSTRSLSLCFYKYRKGFVQLAAKTLSKILFVEEAPLTSVAAIIRREDGKMLFLRLTYMDGLGFPGGQLTRNETVEDALRREVREETGLNVISSRYLWSVDSSICGIGTLCLYFEADACGDLKQSNEGELHWLDLEVGIGNMAYPDAEIAIRMIANSQAQRFYARR